MLRELTDYIHGHRGDFGLAPGQADAIAFFKVAGNPWAEGRVNFLVFDAAQPEPFIFVRMGRDQQADAALGREHELLRTLGTYPALAPFLPLPVVLLHLGGHPILLQSVCRGTRILSETSRRPFLFGSGKNVARHFREALGFVASLNAAVRCPLSRENLARRFATPLISFYRDAGGEGKRMAALANLFADAENLCPDVLFLTPVHGDYSATNVFREPSGQIKVIDWETAIPAGLPCIDFFYFITKYVHNLKTFPRDRWTRVLQAYTAPGGVFPSLVRRHVGEYCRTVKLPVAVARLLFPLHFLHKAVIKTSMRGKDPARPWVALFEAALDARDRLSF
jgi:hypothetical protein